MRTRKKQLESDVESKACSYAFGLGLLHYKFKSANNRGVPDRLFMGHTVDGEPIIFFIEFKRPSKKKVDPLQRLVIDEMREKGGARIFETNDLTTAKQIIYDMVHYGDTLIEDKAFA